MAHGGQAVKASRGAPWAWSEAGFQPPTATALATQLPVQTLKSLMSAPPSLSWRAPCACDGDKWTAAWISVSHLNLQIPLPTTKAMLSDMNWSIEKR